MGRLDVVETARSWIGTPYRHQAARREAGTDCLGLVRGVWCDLFGQEPEVVPAYSMDWSEPSGDEQLWQAARRHLREIPMDEPKPGDVVLFRMRAGSVAKHLGIVTESAPKSAFVHAYFGHGVVESPLSTPWRRRIVARFEFPLEVN
jgi:NlpC/P60 family putative phage cell wall peptidase